MTAITAVASGATRTQPSLWVNNGLVAAVATASTLAAVLVAGPARWGLAAGLVLAAAFAVAEMCAVALPDDGPHFGMAEIPLVVGLVLFPAPILIAAQLVGLVVVFAVWRRNEAVRVAFNLAMVPAATGAAIVAYHLLGQGWWAAIAGVLTYEVVAWAAVARVQVTLLRRMTWTAALHWLGVAASLAAVNACLGVLVAHKLDRNPTELMFLAPVIFGTYLHYRRLNQGGLFVRGQR